MFVDPVMADNGELYKSFSPEFPKGMAGLCKKADIIVPNLTEAAFMLGEQYNPGPYTPGYIEDLLKGLSGMGPEKVVLTGVSFEERQLGAASYDKKPDGWSMPARRKSRDTTTERATFLQAPCSRP